MFRKIYNKLLKYFLIRNVLNNFALWGPIVVYVKTYNIYVAYWQQGFHPVCALLFGCELFLQKCVFFLSSLTNLCPSSICILSLVCRSFTKDWSSCARPSEMIWVCADRSFIMQKWEQIYSNKPEIQICEPLKMKCAWEPNYSLLIL